LNTRLQNCEVPAMAPRLDAAVTPDDSIGEAEVEIEVGLLVHVAESVRGVAAEDDVDDDEHIKTVNTHDYDSSSI